MYQKHLQKIHDYSYVNNDDYFIVYGFRYQC